MAFAEAWYVESRAGARALLRLTDRAGLDLVRQPPDSPFDFLLTLESSAHGSQRIAGIVLLPRVTAAAPRIDPAAAERDAARFADATFPIGVVSFAADDECGYFRWVVEPVVDDGVPALSPVRSARFAPLTDAVLDEIVARVHAWYDARRGDGIAARLSTRRSGTR